MKVAFPDRDGTIVADYPDEQWPNIDEPEFLPGAIEALATFQSKGYQIIIITNQYLIGEGLITQKQYEIPSLPTCWRSWSGAASVS